MKNAFLPLLSMSIVFATFDGTIFPSDVILNYHAIFYYRILMLKLARIFSTVPRFITYFFVIMTLPHLFRCMIPQL